MCCISDTVLSLNLIKEKMDVSEIQRISENLFGLSSKRKFDEVHGFHVTNLSSLSVVLPFCGEEVLTASEKLHFSFPFISLHPTM